MLIKPKLDYGYEVYTSAVESQLDKLNPVQNSAIRIATGVFRSSPIESLHVIAGIKPIQKFREVKLLNSVLRISATPSNPVYTKIFPSLQISSQEDLVTDLHRTLDKMRQLTMKHEIDLDQIHEETPLPYPP